MKKKVFMRVIKSIATYCTNENAVKASFEVSLLIGKLEKSHTITEDLILFAAKVMVSAMVSEETADNLNMISLPNDNNKNELTGIGKY